MKMFERIYGQYRYIKGRFDQMILDNTYAIKATVIYMEAKEKGCFDDVTKEKLLKVARDYQKNDLFHTNVYDTIKFFDSRIAKITGIHFN